MGERLGKTSRSATTESQHLLRAPERIRLRIGSGHRVKQGEVIGYMGMTGLATGVHLDYRVEFNGKYINPAPSRWKPSRAWTR